MLPCIDASGTQVAFTATLRQIFLLKVTAALPGGRTGARIQCGDVKEMSPITIPAYLYETHFFGGSLSRCWQEGNARMDHLPTPEQEREMARQESPPEDSDVVMLPHEKPAETLSEESAELYFLIANFLTNASPCSRAATVLQQELVRPHSFGTAQGSLSNRDPPPTA